MSRAIAVVFAFGAQHEAIESAGLADGRESIEAAGKNLVNVGLVAYVKQNAVSRCIEDSVEGKGQLDNTEIGPKMSAGFGKGLDEECANLLRQFFHLRGVEALEVGRRVDRLKQCAHVNPSPRMCREFVGK